MIVLKFAYSPSTPNEYAISMPKNLIKKDMLVFSAIVPHPPLSIPGIGTKEELRLLEKTRSSIEELSLALEKLHPEIVIVVSPHAPMDPYSFFINSASILKGDFSKFGLNLEMEYKNDKEFVDEIFYASKVNDVYCKLESATLDHGTLIPLWHLLKNIKPRVLHLAFSLRDLPKHFEYGKIIGDVCERSDKRIALIASGDLSHKLTPNAPAGYFEGAKFFDQRIIEAINHSDVPRLLEVSKDRTEQVGECGIRSFAIAMGAVSEKNRHFRVLSYEAPFGVGYMVARLL